MRHWLDRLRSLVRRRIRFAMCHLLNGGHDLYRARTDTKLYQQCLSCGYETPGWVIDVSPKTRRVLARQAKPERRRRKFHIV